MYLPQFLFFCQVLSLSSCFLSHSPPCDRNHFWSPLISSNRRRMFWWTASGKSFFAACLKRFQRFLSKWFGWAIIQKKTRWNSLCPWWALIDILESELVWLGNNSEEDKVNSLWPCWALIDIVESELNLPRPVRIFQIIGHTISDAFIVRESMICMLTIVNVDIS